MSNRIQEFFNEKFGEVRAITVDEIVYFVGLDIAKALGYSNERKAINTHCKRPIKAEIDVVSQNGTSHKARKTQEMLCISKSDIYRLIVRSKLDSADEFESWVFDEILPSIEGTGTYVESGREEEMVSKYFPSFSKEIQEGMVKDLIRQNSELKEFYNDLMNTEGLMSMNIVSKELGGFGLKRLYTYLRNKKIVFYKDDVNIPYQRFMDQNLFQVRETPYNDGKTRSVTYATKKGLDYIRKYLRKNGYYGTLASAEK